MGAWEDANDPLVRDLVNTRIVSEPQEMRLDDLVTVTRYEVEIVDDHCCEDPVSAKVSDVVILAHANRERGCPVCGHDPVAHRNICVPRNANNKRRSRYSSRRTRV